MKIFLTIGIILLQLFASYNVEAKPIVKNVAGVSDLTKTHYFSPAALHTELPAENVQAQAGVTSVQTRDQRLLLYALLNQALQLLSAHRTSITTAAFRDAPAPIPIGRQLLFPQHYFW